MFTEAKKKIRYIANIVKKKKQHKFEKNNFIVNAFFTGFIYNMFVSSMHQMDKGFWVDDKCNKCGVCKKVCPVQNIKLVRGKPVWLHKCEQCMACLQWCPKETIQVGKKTAQRKRYHHPDIKRSKFY